MWSFVTTAPRTLARPPLTSLTCSVESRPRHLLTSLPFQPGESLVPLNGEKGFKKNLRLKKFGGQMCPSPHWPGRLWPLAFHLTCEMRRPPHGALGPLHKTQEQGSQQSGGPQAQPRLCPEYPQSSPELPRTPQSFLEPQNLLEPPTAPRTP